MMLLYALVFFTYKQQTLLMEVWTSCLKVLVKLNGPLAPQGVVRRVDDAQVEVAFLMALLLGPLDPIHDHQLQPGILKAKFAVGAVLV